MAFKHLTGTHCDMFGMEVDFKSCRSRCPIFKDCIVKDDEKGTCYTCARLASPIRSYCWECLSCYTEFEVSPFYVKEEKK